MLNQADEDKTTNFLNKQKVANLQEITYSLNCSIRSAQRRLKAWKVYRSYNKNGCYFVLPSTPNFDNNGLWKYKGIHFSKHGSLKNTVITLIRNAEKGLNASEICSLLELSPRGFISYFNNIQGLRREKHKGRIIYFPDEESIYIKQKSKRESEEKIIQLPSDTVAISVLVELIKYPKSTLQACAQRLRRKGIQIKLEAIQKLLDYHGIEKKLRIRPNHRF